MFHVLTHKHDAAKTYDKFFGFKEGSCQFYELKAR